MQQYWEVGPLQVIKSWGLFLREWIKVVIEGVCSLFWEWVCNECEFKFSYLSLSNVLLCPSSFCRGWHWKKSLARSSALDFGLPRIQNCKKSTSILCKLPNHKYSVIATKNGLGHSRLGITWCGWCWSYSNSKWAHCHQNIPLSRPEWLIQGEAHDPSWTDECHP